MMIGLPGSTPQSERDCAEEICRMGAVGARIYPTLVFRDTELAAMTESGAYTPLSLQEAVERSKNAYEVFVSHGLPCYRIGLCESENLHSDKTYVAGPNHSAMGEMVMSALYRDRILGALPAQSDLRGAVLRITCPVGHVSKVLGHGASTKRELTKAYGLAAVKVVESPKMKEYTVKIDII